MGAPDDINDEQTVRRALAGDEAMWNHLAAKYGTYAYRLAWRITFNEDDAFDAAQETLLKMATRLKDFRGTGTLRSWITTVAIREATTICRRRTKLPVAVEPEQMQSIADQHQDGAGPMNALLDKLDDSRKLQQVQKAMELLSPQQRAILLLAMENDFSPAEIARELDLPANQVRSQQSRAVARLREILSESDERGQHAQAKRRAQ